MRSGAPHVAGRPLTCERQMIHLAKGCSSSAVLKAKPVTPARAGRNWKSVPFKDVLGAFDYALLMNGVAHGNMEKRFALSDNKAVMSAVYDVTVGEPELPKDVTLQIGVEAGNDRHTGLAVYAGFKTKNRGATDFSVIFEAVKAPGSNTIHAQTAGRMHAAVRGLVDVLPAITAAYNNLTVQHVPFTELAASLVNAAQNRLFPWSYIRAGIELWMAHYAHAPTADRNGLAIQACFWECLRGTNPTKHLDAGYLFFTK